MASITLDIAYDEDTLDEAFANLRAEHPGLTFALDTMYGPAAAWPVVEVDGPRDTLDAFVLAYANGDVEEAAFISERIEA